MKYLNFAFWIFLFYLLVLMMLGSCKSKNNFSLKLFFDDIEKHVTTDSILYNFKNSVLDTVVLNYNEYPEIFTSAFSAILNDSLTQFSLEEYCFNNDIDLNSRIGMYIIIASFHKHLNDEDINIGVLKIDMSKLANSNFSNEYFGM